MDPQRWEEIQALFDELAELEAAERGDRLAAIGTADPALRAALESLLAADAEADQRLASIDAALSTRAGARRVQRLKDALAARYRIERELGHGGMATVYLAQDLRHDRKVALKVLRPELAAILGAGRFVREIKTTAGLQHPHILPLFDSGEAASFLYYVMPYIEGERLRDKLKRETPLGIDEAVRITTQIAEALHYAHEQGVIHRDIKPENILLHNSHPLVADFGIALAVRAAAGARMTETGLWLGTPHYMSPEQATAEKAITKRSDIYSLGAVLYEMLTGDPPHTGSTAQQTIIRIVTEEAAPVTSKRKSTPPNVTAAIAKALERLPADRFESAKGFAEALADPGFTVPSPPAGRIRDTGAVIGNAGNRVRWAVGLGAALLAGLAIGILAAPRTSALPQGYDIGLPDSAPLAFAMGSPWGEGWTAFAVSSREDFLVYVADRGGTTELWYRSLVDFETRPIPGTGGAYQPLLSPDDEWVAFLSGNQLKKSRLDRPGVTLVAELERAYGAHWALIDTVAIMHDDGLNRGLSLIDMRSGARKRAPLGERCHRPHIHPKSRTVLCANTNTNIVTVSALEGRIHRRLDVSADGTADGLRPLIAADPRVVDDQYMLFASEDGRLKAAAFDHQHNIIGWPITLQPTPRIEGALGVAQFQVTESGNLFFVPGEDARIGRFVKVNGVDPPMALPIRPGRVQQFDVSPDGTRMVVVQQGVGSRELWFYDLATGRERRWLTAWDIKEPRWTRNGERVVFGMRATADDSLIILIGSQTEPRAPDTLLSGFVPSQVTASGLLLGQIVLRETGSDIAIVHINAESPKVDTIALGGHQGRATISPDGRWLAYMSTESGRDEIFLEPYPSRERRYRVSAGLDPLWLDKTTLVYRTGTSWYRVRVGGSAVYPYREPEFWFRDPLFVDTYLRSQAAHPDGSIIYVQGTRQSTASFIRVIPDWMRQLRRAVDHANR